MSYRSDSFDRANNSGPLGTPSDNLSAWVQPGGTGVARINGNAANFLVTPNIAYLEAGVADVTIQVTTPVLADNGGIVARVADDNNYLLFRGNGSTNKYELYKKVAGSFTLLLTAMGTIPANGDVLKLVCNGSLISCYLNGALIGSIKETASINATGHGLSDRGAATTTFDDFSITAILAACPYYNQRPFRVRDGISSTKE